MVVTKSAINNDELAEFVTSTLNAIAHGAEAAKTENYSFNVPGAINFEVAIRATKSAEAGGGLKIQVFSAEGKKGSEDEQLSKVAFTVTSKDNRPPRPISIPRTGGIV